MCTHPIFQNLKKTHSKTVEKNVTTFSLKILLYWSKIYLAVFWWRGGKEGVTKSFHLWLTCLTLMHLHPAAPSCSCVHLHRYLWSIPCRQNAYFPTTIKVSSKQAALTEVHGRFFFSSINLSRRWVGPTEIVCSRKIPTCWLWLSRNKQKEFFSFIDNTHSPNNLKLILQFNFKLLFCCAWLLKEKRFWRKQHRWITFAQRFQH